MAGLSFASCADVVKTWEVVGDSGIQPRHTFEAQSSAVACVCWNHNNQVLASCNHDGLIALSHVEGKLLGVLPPTQTTSAGATAAPRRESIRSIHFSNGSRYLCSGGTEAVVKVWDLKKKDRIRSFRGHSAPVNAVSFNTDDRHIASGSDAGDVVLHNTTSSDKTGTTLRSARGAEPISALAYSPHAPHELGVATTAGSVMIWDTSAAALLLDLPQQHGAARRGGEGSVGGSDGTCTALAFSPINHKLLVTAGADGTLLCFDVRAAKVVKSFTYGGAITAMDMASDGISIAAGSVSGELVLRDLRFDGAVSSVNGHHPHRIACLRFQTGGSGGGGAARKSKDRSSGGSSGSSGMAGVTPASAARGPVVPSSSSQSLARTSAAQSTSSVSTAATIAVTTAATAAAAASTAETTAPTAASRSSFKDVNSSESGIDATLSLPRAQRAPTLGMGSSSTRANTAATSTTSSLLATTSQERAAAPSSAAAAAADVLQSVAALGPASGLEPPVRAGRAAAGGAEAKSVPRALAPPTSMPRYGEFGSRKATGLGTAGTRGAAVGESAQESARAAEVSAVRAPAPAPSAPAGSGASLFQRALLESIVEDSLSDFRSDMQRDVQNLHLDMLRQFEIQQSQVTSVLEHFTKRWSNLVAENEELRKENELLRNIDF